MKMLINYIANTTFIFLAVMLFGSIIVNLVSITSTFFLLC